MNDQQIIQLLKDTGHFGHPFGQYAEKASSDDLWIGHQDVEMAIDSYQDFMIENLDRLCLKHHRRRAAPRTGMGPATHELFTQPRCGCPDYGPKVVAEAIGTGSWAGCHDGPGYHSALIHVDDKNMPGFLRPHWNEVFDLAVGSFAELGLKFIQTMDKSEANITVTFETRRKGWIGLAIVGSGQSCGSTIWAQFHAGYHPAQIVSMWTQLLKHEWGHNCGLQHTRGGVMSATLMIELPTSWAGDSSEPILNQMFGGKPIPGGPTPPTPPGPVPDDGGYHGILLRSDGAELDCSVRPRGTSPV